MRGTASPPLRSPRSMLLYAAAKDCQTAVVELLGLTSSSQVEKPSWGVCSTHADCWHRSRIRMHVWMMMVVHACMRAGSTYRTRDEINTMRTERDPVERVKKLLLAKGKHKDKDKEKAACSRHRRRSC